MYSYGYRDYYYTQINRETAIEIALRQVPGRVVRVELDYEDGLLVYEIYIVTEYGLYEVEVDANTGIIVKVEREDD